MNAPPRNCPCGRPKAAGTIIERTRTKDGELVVTAAIYFHKRRSCRWTAGTGTKWVCVPLVREVA